MKKIYKIRNVLHRKIGYLELDITLKALFWASQIVSEGGAAGIIEIWTSETCRQKKINCNRAEFLHGSIICHNEAENLLSKSIWGYVQNSCCPNTISISDYQQQMIILFTLNKTSSKPNTILNGH